MTDTHVGYARRIDPTVLMAIRAHHDTLARVGLSEAALQDAGQRLLETAWSEASADAQAAAVARVWASFAALTQGTPPTGGRSGTSVPSS